ncbi:hypothetical protein HanRHA438_Chr05g0233661 [Helianthus annuus]|uniref:Uncharacterized protein n=1 Tax=Helianthus annuus TaxID=4232 RepID=A0A9K3J0Q4_HELAN|nr:hypothetical protein HanXRQr2_Chr05g0224621 [Helianthus annuus]KAJ0585282.1 hypothetical protein HanHA89_Chr05g0198591 [Helianthus annuus]KAJ0919785.1 hypothetical protein HanRHA438_Chr05g0233661 [Helianthus annuus]
MHSFSLFSKALSDLALFLRLLRAAEVLRWVVGGWRWRCGDGDGVGDGCRWWWPETH